MRIHAHLAAGAVAAAAALLAAVPAACDFIPWANRYNAISDQSLETSTIAHFPQGFFLTGTMEGAALILMTALALLAIAVAVAGLRAQRIRGRALVLSTIAALFAGMVLPAAVLGAYLAVVPACAGLTAAVLASRPRAVGARPSRVPGSSSTRRRRRAA